MSVSDSVAFFSPRPSRTGDCVIADSFAAALARLREAATVVRPATIAQFLESSDRRACRCWIGVSPTIKDIEHARRLAAKLVAAGVPTENIRTLLWNEGLPGGLPADIVEKHVGRLHARLPHDPELIAESENRGRLVQQHRPGSSLAKSLEKLAAQTSEWIRRPPAKTGAAVDWPGLERAVAARLWAKLNGPTPSSQEISFQIDQALRAELADRPGSSLDKGPLEELRQRLFDHVTGLGPVETLIKDPAISEIMINGPTEIFVERNGKIEPAGVRFESETQLRTVIDRIVGRAGRRVDLSSPFCDARLPDGSRVNVVLPPLSLNGPVVTIRRFKKLFQTLEDLQVAGSITREHADRLMSCVARRKNILVAGNSGAGKTTLLNVLAGLIPAEERILTLEDAAELQIRQPHVLRMETRARNLEGLGQVTMTDLVVNALRMRPDRLIIGECRGAEVVPMLQAMNTGHDGSLTTIHANSAADALKRLESLVLLNAPEWPIELVREQIRAGIHTIVFIKRNSGIRKVEEIVDI